MVKCSSLPVEKERMSSESSQRATFYLVMREGTEPEHVVVWDIAEVTVGRPDRSDLVIEDSEVSHGHTHLDPTARVAAKRTLERMSHVTGARLAQASPPPQPWSDPG